MKGREDFTTELAEESRESGEFGARRVGMDLSGFEKIAGGRVSGWRWLPVTGWRFRGFDGEQVTVVWRRLVN